MRPRLEEGVVIRVERSLAVADDPSGERDACAGTVLATAASPDAPALGARVVGVGRVSGDTVELPRFSVARLPDAVSFDDACFAGAGAAAIHALRRAQGTLGEWVVLLGTGVSGRLAARIAKLWGYRVIAVSGEKTPDAEISLAPSDDVVAKVVGATRGQGADRVILGLGGAPTAEHARAALRLARHRAKVVVLGGAGALALDEAALGAKEIELVAASSHGPGHGDPSYDERAIDYPLPYVRWTENRNIGECIRLLATRQLDVRSLGVTPRAHAAPARLAPSERPTPPARFTRRSAPHAAALRAALAARRGSAVLTLHARGPLDPKAFLLAEAADALDLVGFVAGSHALAALEVTASAASVALLLRYENGATATFTHTKAAERSQRLEAFKGGACWVLAGDKLEAFGAESTPAAAEAPAPTADEARAAADAAQLALERLRETAGVAS